MDYYIIPLTQWVYFLHTINGLASDLLGSLCQDDNTVYKQIVSQENAAEFYCSALKFQVGGMVASAKDNLKMPPRQIRDSSGSYVTK